MKTKLSLVSIFVVFLSLNSLADTSNPVRCQFGCDVPPQCESLAKATEVQFFGSSDSFELWGVGTITANPSQANPYQIETYGVAGTTANPGHSVFISRGYKDAKNPTGACRVEMVDEKCVSCAVQ